MMFFGVLVFHLIIFITATSFEISTLPETTADEDKVILLKQGLTNYTIVCNVTNNGAIWITDWYIKRPSINSPFAHIGISSSTGLVDYPADLVNEVIISGPPFIGLITYARQFLIKNFIPSFHMTELQCGTLNVRRKFILKIEVIPIVHNDSAAVVEGSDVSITLNVSGSAAGLSIYPPINITTWRNNGEEEIMPSKDINIGYYYINFTNISRGRAGIYSLTVSNGIENSTGYFTLEIYYSPAAIPAYDVKKFIGITEYVTLIAFNSSSIDGWPTPQVSWIHPNGHHINSSTGRYNIDTPGELSIGNAEISDNGTYTCILYNGITTGNNNGSLLKIMDLIIILTMNTTVVQTSDIDAYISTSSCCEAAEITKDSSFAPISFNFEFTTTTPTFKDIKNDTATFHILITVIVASVASALIIAGITAIAVAFLIMKKKAKQRAYSKDTVTTYTINEAYSYLPSHIQMTTTLQKDPSRTNSDSKQLSSSIECNPAYAKVFNATTTVSRN